MGHSAATQTVDVPSRGRESRWLGQTRLLLIEEIGPWLWPPETRPKHAAESRQAGCYAVFPMHCLQLQ